MPQNDEPLENMNHFYRRNFFDSFAGLTNEDHLSFKWETIEEPHQSRPHTPLRKCFSCSQIHVLRSESFATKRNNFHRSVSSDGLKVGPQSTSLLNKCDIRAIDTNDKSRFDFENPVIKITENLQSIDDLDERPFDHFDNPFTLRPNYSNLSSISAEDGSSPADMSPSDYFSHEDNWDIDPNAITCDKSRMPSDSAAMLKTCCSVPVVDNCLHSCTQKSRSLR